MLSSVVKPNHLEGGCVANIISAREGESKALTNIYTSFRQYGHLYLPVTLLINFCKQSRQTVFLHTAHGIFTSDTSDSKHMAHEGNFPMDPTALAICNLCTSMTRLNNN